MKVKIIPITEYDFDIFNLFVKIHYGNAHRISPAIFKVDDSDHKNPKCINCNTMIYGNPYANKTARKSYCVKCGAGIDWSDYIDKNSEVLDV